MSMWAFPSECQPGGRSPIHNDCRGPLRSSLSQSVCEPVSQHLPSLRCERMSTYVCSLQWEMGSFDLGRTSAAGSDLVLKLRSDIPQQPGFSAVLRLWSCLSLWNSQKTALACRQATTFFSHGLPGTWKNCYSIFYLAFKYSSKTTLLCYGTFYNVPPALSEVGFPQLRGWLCRCTDNSVFFQFHIHYHCKEYEAQLGLHLLCRSLLMERLHIMFALG